MREKVFFLSVMAVLSASAIDVIKTQVTSEESHAFKSINMILKEMAPWKKLP